MIPRNQAVALAAAACVAVLMPVLLLQPPSGTAKRGAPPLPPLTADTPPPLAALYDRPLFAAAAPEEAEALPGDAPQLVGIVGRLGEDAVALVRSGEGPARTLRVGESVDGWQLASLAIDAAFFTRGAQRIRVPLPAG